jgi:hypothetical protein
MFKQSGAYSTSPADVDAMIREHIPQWAAAQPAGEPLRVVVWAHGGLIGESDGLAIARKHIAWWKRNAIYPIYFIWETGLFDALRSILESVARRIPGLGARDLFDFTTDPIVQEGVRALGGVHIWGAMKRNAELASSAAGGAHYLAQRLQELSGNTNLNRAIQFHAVGHSAGSIFHSWFLPAASAAGLPKFTTLQLLAPAITIPEFEARMAGHIGGAAPHAQSAIMYTMKKSFEQDDDCIRVYRKSLLYLIHHALEPQRRMPILGLEISIRSNPTLAALFGLNGTSGAAGQVVWSITDGAGRAASRATTHGGFDDDPTTMNSVAANVLDEPRARAFYTGDATDSARGFDGWPISNEWLRGVDVTSVGAFRPANRIEPLPAASHRPQEGEPDAHTAAKSSGPPRPAPKTGGTSQRPSEGKQRALCIGVDLYPGANRLTGCVNDTLEWGRALSRLDFEVTRLTDKQATHAGIVQALRELVATSKTGDVLVFQYSGHGTQVPDYDGDEDDGKDEALVPIDFDNGAFLIDDDLRGIFELLPPHVNLTCFIDCCHSGTITRMLGRNVDADETTHARFLKRTDEWEDWMRAHERFREHEGSAAGASTSSARGLIDANSLRWINFSACDAHETALEHDGNGDFTRIATQLLAGEASGFSHRSFQDAVIAKLGAGRRQTPQLDCFDAARDLFLLRPLD